ncbi:hypothetical protein B0H13DRAFT_1675808 [Mycena leptocephala]|nr:hypothetical protein B0H13DRAFT_1675808 [Mycena leptocephala]
MSSNPNRPDLPEAILSLERATIIGDGLSQIVFGIDVCVFLQAMHLLIYDPPRRQEKRNIPLIAYTFVLFALGTIFVAIDLNGLKLMFVDNRDAPGGPTGFALSQYSKPRDVVGNACAIISDWLAAGLLLYRCVIIFHLNLAIVALPIFIYLAAIGEYLSHIRVTSHSTLLLVLSILALFQSSRPNSHLWTQKTIDFGLPYYALSGVLNVLITLMITTRLFMHRRHIRRTLGEEQAMSVPYTSIAAMLVESSVLYTVTSILFLVPYGLKSDVSNIFIPILIEVQLLAPLLIILRVAKRRGWEKGTAAGPTTSIKFQNNFLRSTQYTADNVDRDVEMAENSEVTIGFDIQMHESKRSGNDLTSSSVTGVVPGI